MSEAMMDNEGPRQDGHDYNRSDTMVSDLAAVYVDLNGQTQYRLLIKDARNTMIAVNAFKTIDIPNEVRSKAKAKILEACKKFGLSAKL